MSLCNWIGFCWADVPGSADLRRGLRLGDFYQSIVGLKGKSFSLSKYFDDKKPGILVWSKIMMDPY